MGKKFQPAINPPSTGKSRVPGKGVFQYEQKIWICFIILAILLIYSRVFSNQFTNWDDDLYILDNPHLKFNWDNLVYIFSHFEMYNYHPVTLLLYSVAHSIGGLNPWIYQLFSLIFHMANTCLVFIFILKLNRLNESKNNKPDLRIPLITAAYFGLHTLQVESVAWMSELKTVLYAFFFLISLICYLQYIESGKIKYYILSLSFFIFSVLSKAMAVSLLLCLPLIDYYVKRKATVLRHFFEKIPYLIICLVFGLIAIQAQDIALKGTGSNFSFLERSAFACYGILMYIAKSILPVNLSAFYCYPLQINHHIPGSFYLFLLIIPSIILMYLSFRKISWVLFGMFFFLVNMLLVLQLLAVGNAVMADRYVYVSFIGFGFVASNMLIKIHEKFWKYQFYFRAGLFIYFLILATLTFHRIGVWRDSITLWNDTIEKGGGMNRAIPYVNRGRAFVKLGKHDSAIEDFSRSISIDPGYTEAFFCRGLAHIETNMFQEAVDDLSSVIKSNPGDLESIIARGLARLKTGDIPGAFGDLNTAIEHKSLNPEVFAGRGYLNLISGNFEHALKDYNEAIKLNTHNLYYYKFRGISEVRIGDYNDALNDFNLVLQTMKDASVYYFRGFAKSKLGCIDDGCKDIITARELGYEKIDPEFTEHCRF